MTVLLGGRAAEQLVFGSITTGASDDLKQVAEISRQMIHVWAMGTSVSALQLSAEGGAVSDRTRELRDAEQQHLADESMRRAMKLITTHRAHLEQLAGALLRQEVLEREDIDQIMADVATPRRVAAGHLWVAAAEPNEFLTVQVARFRADLPEAWVTVTTFAYCSSRARSAPCSSRSSASRTWARSATRAWRASPRRPAWSRCRPM